MYGVINISQYTQKPFEDENRITTELGQAIHFLKKEIPKIKLLPHEERIEQKMSDEFAIQRLMRQAL